MATQTDTFPNDHFLTRTLVHGSRRDTGNKEISPSYKRNAKSKENLSLWPLRVLWGRRKHSASCLKHSRWIHSNLDGQPPGRAADTLSLLTSPTFAPSLPESKQAYHRWTWTAILAKPLYLETVASLFKMKRLPCQMKLWHYIQSSYSLRFQRRGLVYA